VKNVTIALDDEVHRLARIRAAELGTSLSALVKDYLNGLAAGSPPEGVREMPMSYKIEPAMAPKLPPRMLGQMKGEIWYADNWEEWPEGFLDMLNGDNPDDPLNW
jgi:plasmid stability protein